jgi:hypothetical protein
VGEHTIDSERARAEQGERDTGEKTTVDNISSSVWNEAVVKMGALAARFLACARVRSATWDSLRFRCLRRPSPAHRFARLEGPAGQGEAAALTDVRLVPARVRRCSPLCGRQRPSVTFLVSVHAGELVCTCSRAERPRATVSLFPPSALSFVSSPPRQIARPPSSPLALSQPLCLPHSR